MSPDVPVAVTRACWSCAIACEGDNVLRCAACGAVQPPAVGATPFARLAIHPPRFAIDDKELERAWLERSRVVHPDRFARKSDQERRFAAEQTVALNDAWRAIRDPWDRAHWLVTSRGVDVSRLDQRLLVALMEDRERAEESHDDKQAVVAENSQRFDVLKAELGQLLADLDDPTALARAGRVLAEMKTRARLVADLGGARLIASLDAR